MAEQRVPPQPGAIFCVEIFVRSGIFRADVVGLVASSGTDWETMVPDPTQRFQVSLSMQLLESAQHRQAGDFNSAASARVDGTRWPGLNWPLTMASRNQS